MSGNTADINVHGAIIKVPEEPTCRSPSPEEPYNCSICSYFECHEDKLDHCKLGKIDLAEPVNGWCKKVKTNSSVKIEILATSVGYTPLTEPQRSEAPDNAILTCLDCKSRSNDKDNGEPICRNSPFPHLEKLNRVCWYFEEIQQTKKYEYESVERDDLHIARFIISYNKTAFVNLKEGDRVVTRVFDGKTYIEDKRFEILQTVIKGIEEIMDQEENLIEIKIEEIKARNDRTAEWKEDKIDGLRDGFKKFKRSYLSGNKINAITKLVEKLSVKSEAEFDQDLRYLNMQNGVYDLEMHQLIDHSPDMYMSLIMPTEYNSKAVCPEFDNALSYMFDNDQEMINFWLEVYASSLGRKRHDESIFILNGKTADNGKTAILIAMSRPFGVTESGYAVWMDTKAFATTRVRNATQPELLRAINKCTGIIDEPDKEDMDIGALKNVSNTGLMTLRQLYEPSKEKNWTATMIFLCNKLPVMDMKDAGTARRVIVIPVRAQITDDMKKAKRLYSNGEHLKFGEYLALNESSGIVNKILAAYKRFQDRGYMLPAPPLKVIEATEQYIQRYNPIKQFISEKYTTKSFPIEDTVFEYLRGSRAYCNASDFNDRFVEYCREELKQDKTMQTTSIRDAVEALGYENKTLKEARTNRKSIRAYDGIRELYPNEKPDMDKSQSEKRKLMINVLSDMGQNKERIGVLKYPVALPDLKKEIENKFLIDSKEAEAIIKELRTIGDVQTDIVINDKGSIMYVSIT